MKTSIVYTTPIWAHVRGKILEIEDTEKGIAYATMTGDDGNRYEVEFDKLPSTITNLDTFQTAHVTVYNTEGTQIAEYTVDYTIDDEIVVDKYINGTHIPGVPYLDKTNRDVALEGTIICTENEQILKWLKKHNIKGTITTSLTEQMITDKILITDSNNLPFFMVCHASAVIIFDTAITPHVYTVKEHGENIIDALDAIFKDNWILLTNQ